MQAGSSLCHLRACIPTPRSGLASSPLFGSRSPQDFRIFGCSLFWGGARTGPGGLLRVRQEGMLASWGQVQALQPLNGALEVPGQDAG